MKRSVVIIIVLFFVLLSKAEERSIPYTQSDRDRMVRLETKVEGLDTRIDDLTSNVNSRFGDVSNKIDRLENKFDSYFMWGFGLVLMSIFGLIGFIIYDRRTTLAPVEYKTERILIALRVMAEKDPVIREALKRTALW